MDDLLIKKRYSVLEAGGGNHPDKRAQVVKGIFKIKSMILLLLAYLYKFQVKPHLNNFNLIVKRPNTGLVQQPVMVKQKTF